MVQLCLRDQQNVFLFKNVVRSIAQSEHMKFIDGSTMTQKDLNTLKVGPKFPLVYIGVDGADGVGMEGGNLGLSAYEVALGFSEGSNSVAAHRFADTVVGELKKRWPVFVVPRDRGATHSKNCEKQ
jgi:hypothetical protein